VLSEEGMQASYNAIDNYFTTSYGMLSREGRASRASQTQTIEGLDATRKTNAWNEVNRNQIQKGFSLQDQQRELEGKIAEQDIAMLGLRYAKNWREMQLTLGGNQMLMENPNLQTVATIASLGFDTNSPALEAMLRTSINGYTDNPRAAFFTAENYNTYLQQLSKHYDNIDLNVVTSGSASATASQLNGLVNSAVQVGTRMTLDESKQVMKVLAQDGVAGIRERFPEAYETLAVNVQKTLPNFGRTFVHKLENDLEKNEEFLRSGLYIQREEDGTFSVGSAGNATASQKSKFKSRYVDTLNTYAQAMVNVGGVDSSMAAETILENVDTTRVIGMYRKHFDKVVQQGLDAEALANSPLGIADPTAVIRFEGEAKVEEMTRKMVDGLFGEGAYVTSQEKWLMENGYQLQGKTNKGYLRFVDGNGRTKHLRVE